MVEIEAKAKKWGSSIGIIIPKEIVDEIGIKPDSSVRLDIKAPLKVKDVFGMFPRFSKKSAQEIKDEMRKGW